MGFPAILGAMGSAGGAAGGGGAAAGGMSLGGKALPYIMNASAAPFAIGGSIAQILAQRKQAKYNADKLETLQRKEKAGNLGLTGLDRQLLGAQLQDPVRQAAAAAEQQAELQAAAAGSSASGADLAQLRTERGRTVAQAAQQAALQIAGADLAERRRQEAEIEQRLAFQAGLRQQNIESLTSALAQTTGALGQAAGSAAGVGTSSGLFGRKLSGDEYTALQKFARENPEEFNRLILEELGPSPEAGGGTGTTSAAGGS